ncbi:hypothetical protein [Phycicoccus sp.]|uniref:hypothetical protein n=1 Tax=Phycicoccus sp. TaxID=1902410 RepID=UPI002BA1F601|nr:hypothetical protein [Phycicoccus sp.]HMM94996.1 hypothetical protein [Phycicoccus sp.]
MTLTSSRLTAAAAVCATTAGALYIAVQIGHPAGDVAHVVTTDVFVREMAKAAMAVLAIAGFTGMFLRNRARLGLFGAASFALLVVGYVAMFANQVVVGCVLPVVARTDPTYVQAYLDGALGGTPGVDIGHVQQLFLVTGIGYSVGGLLFGIALLRAGILARTACVLLSVGTVSALALSALPDSFNRPFAVPVGVALITLGISLWRNRTDRAASSPEIPATDTHVADTHVAEPAVR